VDKTRYTFLLIIDAILINLSVFVALLLRFDGSIPAQDLNAMVHLIPLFTLVSLAFLLALKLYNRVWEYASIGEMFAILRATTCSMGVIILIIYLFSLPHLPRSVYIASWVLMNIFIGASRISWRVFRGSCLNGKNADAHRVLIVGAGDAGDMLVREIQNNPQLKLKAVGFIDDDRSKLRKIMHNVPVLGTTHKIPALVKELEINLNSVKFIIPPEAISIASNLKAIFTANSLDSSAAASSLQNMSTGQQLLGSVYELNCTSEASVSGLNLQQAVTVTLSYSAADMTGINEDLLDVYYYDESKKTWTPMKGTVDKDKNTITFTTTHFSKYAIMTKAEEKPATGPKIEPTKPTNPTTTGAEKFTDLTGHWAAAEIGNAVKLGIASGISPTQFAPDRNITRAEFAALLTRAIGLKNTPSIQSRFSDVTTDAWYYNFVNSAAEAGLINGYSPTKFGPNDLITREQMAVMISNALAYKNKQLNVSDSVLSKFKDRGQISSWAIPGVSTAVDQGIITGRSANTIAPRHNATRAEGTAMILRMHQLL
jgi:hypothetical protein